MSWTFLSNHGHVLVYLGSSPDARLKDIAEVVGITERSAHGILQDLIDGGYVTKLKAGRRNSYALNPNLALRHPAEANHSIGELINVFASPNIESK
ncbi:MAG: hypothetical protein RIS82_1270 [Actinomycetota bacterium]